ncbi:ABC transporter ATP-binding protein [Rhizobium halophytocola]|uniref:ABC-type Fe3+/spermidine/putrescine transport system ATPase subunit n=1 Tax=Rhizobium halophytocola TaxID=735519 RepID=A0ABS4E4D5_9HYPH|nr:ABC transporter ATP-binding protein [Rhizobium halophytocola]MBP1852810.1 ABC-type Fe3+/spermidine/putrescine transport system ATPase subunit [Rhizobium halophytocola]
MNLTDIELCSVSKDFGGTAVVKNLDLQIPQGEFVSVLGPSGCGKTTTLNMIAGFSAPSAGEIRIRGRNQAGVPPERRNLGLVFQNYALFPHMTVAENIGFGLRMRHCARSEIEDAVAAALSRVHLEGYSHRYPRELSGGQQQRVALARAIAPGPSLLLLDEPLSNLDLKLREAMRIELKEIQERLGMTFIYVTHDQEEAMAMSDQIVVMWQGAVAQVGPPSDIYARPQSRFVASFIGKSNIFPVAVSATRSPHVEIVLAESGPRLLADMPADPKATRFCCMRPENIKIIDPQAAAMPGDNRLQGRLVRVVTLGAYVEVLVEVAPGVVLTSLMRSTRAGALPAIDGPLTLSIPAAEVQLLTH